MAHSSDAFSQGVVIKGNDTRRKYKERAYLVNICERVCLFLSVKYGCRR